jgi:glycosyltransferase involved in cell wall biosynthesis
VHDFGAVCPTAHNIHQDLSPCKTGYTLKCLRQHHHKHSLPIYFAQLFSFFIRRRKTRKNITQLHTVSPILAHYLKQHYSQPITVIPPFHLETTAITSTPPHPHHFLYAGHLGSHKGLTHLLNEFALALKTLPSLQLTIAGDGIEKKTLEKYCETLKITHAVKFIGWQNALNEHYLQHAATIVPSLWMEAFGLIITESMAHQRAVIGSNRGAIPWLISDRETGLIFNPLIKGDLAQKIIALAQDPSNTLRLGLAGQAKLKTLLNNETALTQLMQTYQNTIRQHAKNPTR